jgi:hypothetical protein
MLGLRMGIDARGFTRSMEVVFKRPARVCVLPMVEILKILIYHSRHSSGDTLEILSTSTIQDNVRSARCEVCPQISTVLFRFIVASKIRNKKSGEICATVVQILGRLPKTGKTKL